MRRSGSGTSTSSTCRCRSRTAARGGVTSTCTPENDCPIDRSAGLANDAQDVAVDELFGRGWSARLRRQQRGRQRPRRSRRPAHRARRIAPREVKKIRIIRKGHVYTLRWKLSEPASIKIRVKRGARSSSPRPRADGPRRPGGWTRQAQARSATRCRSRPPTRPATAADVRLTSERRDTVPWRVMGSVHSRGASAVGGGTVPRTHRAPPAGAVRRVRCPGAHGGADAARREGQVGVRGRRHGRRGGAVELGGVRRAAVRDGARRHPLRDEVVEAGHELRRRVARRPARRRRAARRGTRWRYSYGGYTTNLALEDLSDGKAWIVTEHEGGRCPASTAARLDCSSHLYFWKSAKWVAGPARHGPRRARLLGVDGYHNRGDPSTRSDTGTTDRRRAEGARRLADRDRHAIRRDAEGESFRLECHVDAASARPALRRAAHRARRLQAQRSYSIASSPLAGARWS